MLAWRGRWPRTLGLLLLSAVIVCLVFLPQERFRIPVIDPVLIVGAAALVTRRWADSYVARGFRLRSEASADSP
jgi:hypothetical protein